MFSHIMLGSNDIARSKKFYDAIMGLMGCPPAELNAKERLIYMQGAARLLVGKPLNGQPATAGNGSTVGFTLNSPEDIDAWHKAGVANGGEAIENPPGIRQARGSDFYLAYLRDPDGNKLCALYAMPSE